MDYQFENWAEFSIEYSSFRGDLNTEDSIQGYLLETGSFIIGRTRFPSFYQMRFVGKAIRLAFQYANTTIWGTAGAELLLDI